MSRLPRLCAAAFFLLTAKAGLAVAAGGVTADAIRFVQLSAFDSGPSVVSEAMRQGILAAFDEQNRAGGVQGRRLELDAADDSYQPDKTLVEARRLIRADQHIAMIGNYGTATGSVSQPLAAEAGWPFIAPVSGAQFLRDAGLGNVFNIRETYANEMAAAAAYLVDELNIFRIAVLYQDDGFGRSGLEGVRRALKERRLVPAAEMPYMRRTTAVKVAVLNARKAEAQAVMVVGVGAAAQVFIETGWSLGYEPTYVATSVIEAAQLAKNLGERSNGLMVTQVVPFPQDASAPLVAQYQAALGALDPEAKPDFISLEGYIAGRVAIRALESIDGELSRAALLEALRGLRSFDLGGVEVSYDADDNQGLSEVYLTEMDGAGGFWSVDAARVMAKN